jgi:CO/xanthine dehydrogenase FAD-binding subunit
MGELKFYHPRNLDDALSFLNQDPQVTRVVAGGTDLFLQVREKQIKAQFLVDLSHVPELQFVQKQNGSIVLGPTLTLNDVIRSQLLRDRSPGLIEAASSIGSPQIRNRGTVGGNIGRASPAGDCSVALLSLNARITLRSVRASRTVSLAEFFVGPGSHIGKEDELISEITLPICVKQSGSSFIKLGKRKALVLAIAAVAVYIELDENAKIKEVRIALGSLAPTPCRSFRAEEVLRGRLVSTGVFEEAGQAALDDISPIDDLRASAQYRKMVTPILVQRALISAARRAGAIILGKSEEIPL